MGLDLTIINSDVEKLKELSQGQKDNESEFLKKYSNFVDEVVVKLKDDNSNNTNKNRSKRKQRERTTGFEKIQNDINLILTKSNSFCQKDSTEKIRSKKKTELRIKKVWIDIKITQNIHIIYIFEHINIYIFYITNHTFLIY